MPVYIYVGTWRLGAALVSFADSDVKNSLLDRFHVEGLTLDLDAASV